MHAGVAARFLLLDLKLQAKETEFMAALQSVIAVVHLMAYCALLHEFRGHDLHAGEIPCLKVDWPHQCNRSTGSLLPCSGLIGHTNQWQHLPVYSMVRSSLVVFQRIFRKQIAFKSCYSHLTHSNLNLSDATGLVPFSHQPGGKSFVNRQKKYPHDINLTSIWLAMDMFAPATGKKKCSHDTKKVFTRHQKSIHTTSI
jgi:hypothetical protein